MGSVCASPYEMQTVADKRNENMDRILSEEKEKESLNFKILLLGTGESGKSTIVKQLIFIHKKKMPDDERKGYIKVLQTNTIQCMSTYLEEAAKFGYPLTDEEQLSASAIMGHDQRNSMSPPMVEDIETLWRSDAIQKTYARRNEFWHLEASDYFFENCHRFCEPEFAPTEEDVVMARRRTTGVVVTGFEYGGVNWSVVDVGGQRSERRKWINCFENVKALFFVENLSGYGKVLFEDKAINRMRESLDLFEKTVANPIFEKTPIFLFLNKKDLFEDMLKRKPLKDTFPEYEGAQDTKEALEFISNQFQSRLPPKKDKAVVLFLAARVKKDVQYAFDEVKNFLVAQNKKAIERALKAAGKKPEDVSSS